MKWIASLRALLIQKSVKLRIPCCDVMTSLRALLIQKSVKQIFWHSLGFAFESFVNSEECKTDDRIVRRKEGLRALLIQKSVKQNSVWNSFRLCLRALLIQKSVKQRSIYPGSVSGLRALLIQKSVKLIIQSVGAISV